MDLRNAVIIVTGASRGIGKALMSSLTEAGATVIGCARTASENIRAVDVSDSKAMADFVQSVITEHGKLDVLINNAGVIHKPSPMEEVSIADYKQCMEVNTDGVFYGMHAALPSMKESGAGMIINVASRAGSRVHPTLSAYCASKFAVIGLTQTVAKELNEAGSAVQCISISPGGVDTDMRAELFGEAESNTQQGPEVVAGYIVDVLTGDLPVNNGDNIQIVHGEVKTTVMQ